MNRLAASRRAVVMAERWRSREWQRAVDAGHDPDLASSWSALRQAQSCAGFLSLACAFLSFCALVGGFPVVSEWAFAACVLLAIAWAAE